MSASTFSELYCEKNGVSPEEFARSVLARTLYRRARPVAGILRFFSPNYFVADFDLIHGVAHLRRTRDFSVEAARFNEHPANRGFLRRWLRLRVSTHRLRYLIKETLGHSVPVEAEADKSVNAAS